MIGYRTYNALITHKGEIIKQLTKDYMLDYHLPYLDALKNAVREFDIKAEVLSASFKKAKKITSKSQAEYSKKQDQPKINVGAQSLIHLHKRCIHAF